MSLGLVLLEELTKLPIPIFAKNSSQMEQQKGYSQSRKFLFDCLFTLASNTG